MDHLLYETEKGGARAKQQRKREGERWSIAVEGLQRG
jgi:hypothetical protein